MSIYKELDEQIEAIARNDDEKKQFKELVTKHFEGKDVWRFMPDALKVAVIDWEQAQKDRA